MRRKRICFISAAEVVNEPMEGMRSELGNQRNIMKAIRGLCEEYPSRPQYAANFGKNPFWFLQMFENIVAFDNLIWPSFDTFIWPTPSPL